MTGLGEHRHLVRRGARAWAGLTGLLILPASAAIAPALASATTARVDGGVIVVEDAQGIDDQITVSSASKELGPTILITGATPGAGCTQDAREDALCPDGTGADGRGTPHSIHFVLGDGDDEVNLRHAVNTGLDDDDVTFETGSGEDRVDLDANGRFLILTGSENDIVHFDGGGPGAQEAATVDTGGGDDTIKLRGNEFVGDAVDGGPGNADRVTYAGRPARSKIRIISDPNRPSGRVGEANPLGENDRLANLEVLQGHSGRNSITGSAGDDTLIGGPGRDRLRGNAGDDTLITHDGARDQVARCGLDGDDVAIIDLRDRNPNKVPGHGLTRNCETVMRQPHGQRPLLLLTRAHEGKDAVRVRAECVRSRGCRGILVVTDRRRRPRSQAERFSLAHGDSETFRLSLDVGRLTEGAQVVARTRNRKGRVLESSVVL